MDRDPRLYVFLRQQWEEQRNKLGLDCVIADTLILYALEDTDSNKGIFMTKREIVERVAQTVQFTPRSVERLIKQRLKSLTTKPRRVTYHRAEDAYCLSFEERSRIQDRNLKDMASYSAFCSDTASTIERYAPADILSELNLLELLEDVLHTLFYRQGLEFADFILNRERSEPFEESITEIISEVASKHSKPTVDLNLLKSTLLVVIRSIVYSGTPAQKSFLDRLSSTYMMLLLLQCDPKLATYFSALAGSLWIYVCTSIIIPALSERFLEQPNRRYTNLLMKAREAGVKFVINDALLNELTSHFRMVKAIYRNKFEGYDLLYSDDSAVIYINEILIRAYFYARIRGQVDRFDEFINYFVSPSMNSLRGDIVTLLKSDFGIDYIPYSHLGIHLNPDEITEIQQELVKYKEVRTSRGSAQRARNHADVMLTVHALREQGNELATTGIFGYKTWWLSSDVTTQQAAVVVTGNKYGRSCYIRPDFLYDYISFAPTKGQIDQAFQNIFPSLLGVNISFALPDDVTKMIHKFVKEHAEQSDTRMKAILRELADDLKENTEKQNAAYASEFLRRKYES